MMVIIVVLSVLVILFATNKISFNFDNNDNTNESNTENNDEDLLENENVSGILSNDEKYNTIITEYKLAINDVSIKDNLDVISSKYKNVNERIITFYHLYENSSLFKYIYYDIDDNGNDELIISQVISDSYSIIDIFTYNGAVPVKLIDESSLGDRSSLKIWDNGILYLSGSGGASSGNLEFSKIALDGYSKQIVQTYYYLYDENNNISFYKKLNQDGFGAEDSKYNYTSISEVESVHLSNASVVDMGTLDWNNI